MALPPTHLRDAPFKIVQDFTGHSTAEMTAHYMHLDPEPGREVAKLLDLSGSQVDIALTEEPN
jgi:integrase